MKESVVMLALGATVLLQLDPVELVVYLDTTPAATRVDEVVAEAACQYVGAEQVPLPVPYTVRVFKRSGESQRYVPQHSPIATGLLSRCPARVHDTALE
jgi:hypothetical protein